MKRDDSSPEAYIDSVEGDQKEMLVEIRKTIFEIDPQAEEFIEYGMLSYRDLANLAAQKNYVSLYVPPKALTKYKEKYTGANCGKCCLRIKSIKQFDPSAVKYLLKLVMEIRLGGGDVNCCD